MNASLFKKWESIKVYINIRK